MRKKYALPAAVLATAALGLTACAAGGGAPAEKPAETDNWEGETLSVWIMQGTNPNSEEFFAEVGEAFTEKTGAELEVEFVQWADAHDRFVTSIAGDTTPDVAETGTTWTAEFADSGALEPLDSFVEEAGLSDDLVEGLVASGTYEEELYGMPWYAGVRSVIYRTDVFEELGLEPPTSWDELVAAGQTIKEKRPDLIPFPVPGDAEMSTYPWVWGADGTVATEKGGEWTSGLDSDESREGIEFWTNLALKEGFSTPGATTWKETDVLDNFSQEKVAMAVMGSWAPGAILGKNPALEGKIGAFPIPSKDGGIADSVLGGSHLSMFNSTEHPDLAFAFIEMMTSGEFAEAWGEQSGYFPGQVSLLEKVMESDDPLVQPFAQQMVEAGGSLPVTPKFGAVQAKKTTNAMIQAILSGTASVDDATKTAAAEMNDILNGK